jgi:hypothetical protein
LLRNTEQIIDISIKFGWPASRRDLDNDMRKISDTRVLNLPLDGVTHSMHPQGNVEYRNELFHDHIDRSSLQGTLQSVTLLNYPRPQEQCTYFRLFYSNLPCRLRWRQLQRIQTGLWLMDLRMSQIEYPVNAIVENQREGLSEALQYLHGLLTKAGCDAVFTLGITQRSWHGEFNWNQGTLRALQVYNLSVLEANYNTGRDTIAALEALESLNINRVINRSVQGSPQPQNSAYRYWKAAY